ncbi:G-type lectin S-receptor-like serine/threonine-protein kinase [Abeliophyllum distichum]|uniref:G-type lectin S-receptor-like serine/threonine-protein kinase n=1 Tax=Abeliophyllum distichum TaxID=126358 RepID=A0ABD1TEV9_9LAMI
MMQFRQVPSLSSAYAEEGNILRFLKLDNDGNLRIYSSTIGSRTQIERWAVVDDMCQIYGFCSNMGICSYNDSNPVVGVLQITLNSLIRGEQERVQEKSGASGLPWEGDYAAIGAFHFLDLPS